MARFFIDRPVFAWVLAIVTMLAGVLALRALPVAQYPSIAPPMVQITARYPGASARTLEDTVTQVIEQRMKALDGLSYMSSASDSTGQVTISLTFDNGVDPDIAQVQVQNKLALATPLLPQAVQQQGVTVVKSARNFLSVLAFYSTDGRLDDKDLSDFVAATIQDPISRVPGVGETQLFGAQYAMRIWLDPDRLASFKLTPADVTAAIQAQNAQVSAGQLGALPAVPGQALNATIQAQSRLRSVEQFREVLVKTQTDGSRVRLGDVARVELGAESYSATSRFNGKPAAGLAIKLAAGANALDTVEAVRAKLAALEPVFPPGVAVAVPYDTTPFVKLAIEEVVKTLAEAVLLVFLVMYLFLQNLRATLIPTIAVPVVLLGTFAVLMGLGYSINVLTMFAMVLAIGLLVDDAIVVVENVERVMREDGLSPREATRKSMSQIGGALVGIALVLGAVFVPMAFFGGSTGVIYRQFSVTIVAAMTLSVLTALVLTPALCATLLRPHAAQAHDAGAPASRRGFFGAFERLFGRGSAAYQGGVRGMLRRPLRWLIVFAVLAAVMAGGMSRLPRGFLPDEDQGVLFTLVQLPPNAPAERTLEAVAQVEHHYLVDRQDAVEALMTVTGFSFAGSGQNMAIAFVKLKPWDQRRGPGLSAQAVAGGAMRALSSVRDASIFALAPPAVSELGTATGFDMMLLDQAGQGHEALMQARNQLLGMAAAEPTLAAVRPNGMEDAPTFEIEIDRAKAAAQGLAIADVNAVLASAWGGAYVDDFVDRGRVKRVYLQADARFRARPEDLAHWYARNASGQMVPFDAFATGRWVSSSPKLERYNGSSSVEIQGMATPGLASSGDAMATMAQLVARLPRGFGLEWTGLSLQERSAGAQTLLLYGVSVLFVFLCLAALYESWAIPVSVLLVVPLGVLGTLAAAFLTGKNNDVYFQVGLLTTIGLASKNAILIVEFAKDAADAGLDAVEAALAAARMRLRPIVMTSMAFVLGVLPLALASGAGAGAQSAIGMAVLGGMLSSTFLAIWFVPVFFVVVTRLLARRPTAPRAPNVPAEGH